MPRINGTLYLALLTRPFQVLRAQIIHRLYLIPRATTIILLLSTKVLVVVHQGNRQMR